MMLVAMNTYHDDVRKAIDNVRNARGTPNHVEALRVLAALFRRIVVFDHMPIETLLRILRTLPRDRFVAEAIRLCLAGEIPDATLLRRCGIRPDNSASVLGIA